MPKELKICEIGAGSSHTPELVEGVLKYRDSLPVSKLALMDIDERKLGIVGGMAARTLDEKIPLQFGAIGQETTGPGGFAKALRTTAAVSLIDTIANDRNEVHIVNVPNQEAVPDMPEEAVVEIACQIGRDGARPLPVRQFPESIRGLIQAVKAYEVLAAKAGAEGDRQAALQDLLAHPLVPSFDAARGLLAALLGAHRAFLPQFFPEGAR